MTRTTSSLDDVEAEPFLIVRRGVLITESEWRKSDLLVRSRDEPPSRALCNKRDAVTSAPDPCSLHLYDDCVGPFVRVLSSLNFLLLSPRERRLPFLGLFLDPADEAPLLPLPASDALSPIPARAFMALAKAC